jgi:two-component system sensor histidine kinase KdpD
VVIVGLSLIVTLATSDQLGEVGGALIFMLAITIAGAFYGLVAALITAIAAFLLYNFYIAEPILTFRIETGKDVAPLIVFNLCAVISGILSGRLQDRALAAQRSNMQLLSLLEVSQALQSAIRLQDIGVSLSSAVLTRLGIRIHLSPTLDAWLGDDPLLGQAGASQVPRSFTAYRLTGGDCPRGFLIAEIAERQVDPAFMHALCNVTALALDRASLWDRVTEARAAARADELQTALLSSVSHDFRTPLTAISASASSLIDYREQLDTPTSIGLLRGIVEECERLNRYTSNLIEMSRLEAGQPHIPHQALSVSEILGVVVTRLRGRAGSRQIVCMPADDDLVICANAPLFELAMANILDNAVAYSEDGSRIDVSWEQQGQDCVITVCDEGLGIPESDLERIFERFVRVMRAEASPSGSGLGLAIARGFVEVLGGDIVAATPGIGDRGTRITIRLPLVRDAA